jgi:hypothetical protein
MTGPGDVWAAAFVKPTKLWRPAPSWKPHEWTPLAVALGRIKDRLGDLGWAEIDLHQDFVAGRVKSALRYLLSDDGTKQIRLLLQPKFWPQLKIIVMGLSEPVLVEGEVEGQPLESTRAWLFFALTADLDEHYPVVPAARPPGVVQLPPPDFVQPPQRRRGPATTHDWFAICGEIARRCIDPKTGRVRVPKNESALARDVNQWLENQDLGQTAESEMREAVKRVCAALQTAQK